MTKCYRFLDDAQNGLRSDILSLIQKWLEKKQKTVTAGTLKSIESDLAHWSRYCQQEQVAWLPTTRGALCRYVRKYQNERSNGAIQRLVVYLRELNRVIGTNLSDVVLDQVLEDLAVREKYSRRQPIRFPELAQLSSCLGAGVLDLYTRALLWALYDTQFRISSLLNVKLEDVKVLRPGGEVWLPPPSNPINWEEDGGFLPPSTACHIRDWFNEVGIVDGYMFPQLRRGQATDERGLPANARRNVLSTLAAAGQPTSVTFRAIREGAIEDISEADIGIPRIMKRGRFRTYRSVKRILSGSDNLDGSSLTLARLQSRWGSPSGY